MSKSKRLITVTAGRLVYAVCYTQAKSTDSEKVRAAKNRCSSAARQKMNFKTLYKNVQLQMCANFDRHDLWVTMGFDDEHLPPNRREAKKAMQKTLTSNVHFATAPASGAVITADYHTSVIAKDANHVFDFSLTLQFGEYTA